MVLMMSSLYDALPSYDNRVAKIEGDLGILKWVVGFNLAMTAAVLAKLLI